MSLHSSAAIIDTPIGKIAIHVTDTHLTKVSILSDTTPTLCPITKLADEACKQLHAYFKQANHLFTLPLALNGTPHQLAVWQALQQIPLGQTRYYQQLALAIGSHPRAIGQACRTNPFAIIIPCHRVVTKTGDLGGFMGNKTSALQKKAFLLIHEKKI